MLASLTVPFYVSPFPLLLVQPVSGTVVLSSFPLCAISFTVFHLLLCCFFFISFVAALDKNCFPVGQRKVSCARKEKLQTYFPCKNKQTKKTHIPTNQTGDTLPVQAILMPCSACLLFAESEQHSEILPFCLVGVIHAGWVGGEARGLSIIYLLWGAGSVQAVLVSRRQLWFPLAVGRRETKPRWGWWAPPQGGLGPWLEATRGSGAAGLNRPKLLLGHHEAAEKFSVSWAMAC